VHSDYCHKLVDGRSWCACVHFMRSFVSRLRLEPTELRQVVHQHGACVTRNRRQSMGRSRGGLTSKIHAVVDTNGLPVLGRPAAFVPDFKRDSSLPASRLSCASPAVSASCINPAHPMSALAQRHHSCWRLAGLLEFDDLGDLVLAARALINALIITITGQKSG
jgi:hypothetical protein